MYEMGIETYLVMDLIRIGLLNYITSLLQSFSNSACQLSHLLSPWDSEYWKKCASSLVRCGERVVDGTHVSPAFTGPGARESRQWPVVTRGAESSSGGTCVKGGTLTTKWDRQWAGVLESPPGSEASWRPGPAQWRTCCGKRLWPLVLWVEGPGRGGRLQRSPLLK